MMRERSNLEKILIRSGVVADKRAAKGIADARLSLPEDAERTHQLRLKLSEYRQRHEMMEYYGREKSVRERAKLYLLAKVLTAADVRLADAWNEFVDIPPPPDERNIGLDRKMEQWLDAVDIIGDYLGTGGQNVEGGTGLPERY
jgi:hypothetical protein